MKALNSTFIPFIKQYKISLIFSILFFLLYLPLVLHVNFYQNDDWYYYRQVAMFLKGQFRLQDDIGTTFYGPGFMGMIFAYFFKLSSLPILTLLISTLSVFVFSLILQIRKASLLLHIISYIIFISFPVFSYSTLGYMVENYILFFVLCSILCFNLFLLKNNAGYYYLSLFFIVCSFFVKQNVVVLFVIYFVYLALKKDYKKSIISLISLIGLMCFYKFLFPQTFIMRNSQFTLLTFLPSNLAYVFYVTLGYFLVLVIPLFSFFSLNRFSIKNKKSFLNIFLVIILFCVFYVQYSIYSLFKIYPFFGNTFAHLGYLYGSIDGNKPVANYLSGIALMLTKLVPYIITTFVFYLVLRYKTIFKSNHTFFYLIGFILFEVSNLLLVKFYDRYLIIPFVLFLLFFVEFIKENKFSKIIGIIVIPFLFLNLYISILFSWDFVLTNNYVYSKSRELVSNKMARPEQIYGNGAWIEEYHNKGIDKSKYIFYYDKELPKEFRQNYIQIESKEFNQLKPFYKDSKIYLFKAK